MKVPSPKLRERAKGFITWVHPRNNVAVRVSLGVSRTTSVGSHMVKSHPANHSCRDRSSKVKRAGSVSELQAAAWKRVYRGLFRGTIDECVKAVAQICEWRHDAHRLRNPALCPAYADATGVLLSVILAERYRDQIGREALRMSYVGALSYLVTVMVDTSTLCTYRTKAQQINMPTEITEIRNIAAHGKPPPLSQLRWVSMVALAYLHTDFWKAEASLIESRKKSQLHLDAKLGEDEQVDTSRAEDVAARVSHLADHVDVSRAVLSLDEILARLGPKATPRPEERSEVTDWT